MDLYIWLAKNRVSKTSFAKMIGISRTHLHRIINGYSASLDLLKKIEDITCAEVTRFDIKPGLKKPKKKGPRIKQLDAFE